MVPADADCKAFAPASGAIARVSCRPSGTNIDGNYWLYDNQAGIDGYVKLFSSPYGQWRPQACPGMGKSPQNWHRAATPQQTEGKIICGSANGQFTLHWTIDTQLVMADMSGDTIDQVFQWWAAHYQ
jgi:hypothetical protein